MVRTWRYVLCYLLFYGFLLNIKPEQYTYEGLLFFFHLFFFFTKNVGFRNFGPTFLNKGKLPAGTHPSDGVFTNKEKSSCKESKTYQNTEYYKRCALTYFCSKYVYISTTHGIEHFFMFISFTSNNNTLIHTYNPYELKSKDKVKILSEF